MPPINNDTVDRGVSKSARKASKSRSGCQTCKVKRLKCDETKPACQNCVKRNLTCPGYKQVLRWSTKYEALQPDHEHPRPAFHQTIEYEFAAIDPSKFNAAEASTLSKSGEPAALGFTAPGSLQNLVDRTKDLPCPAPSRFQLSGGTSEGVSEATTSLVPVPSGEQLLPFDAFAQRMLRKEPKDVSSTERRVGRTTTNKATSASSQSIQWKTLLRSYYRMSAPSLPRSLQNEASALVEHYFRDVCVIFSCFDSAMNPFRTVIARLWDNSSSIFFAIQSMAAAHLANYIPSMRVTGLTMQRKAYECLQQELQLASINQTMDDKLLLAVLLLGLTACWHDSSDLGIAHLSAARALIYPRLLREDSLQGAESKRNDQFFAEALIYWEMCNSFVSEDTYVPGMERRLPAVSPEDEESSGDEKVFPHPWTGIAPRLQMLFAEVGRLIRHYCTIRTASVSELGPSFTDIESIVSAARDLEEELLGIRIPTIDKLVDVQDERTSSADFINIAEATRCSALLEIYRVFPEILNSRLGTPDNTGLHAFFTFDDKLSSGVDPDHTSWLTSLAIHTLNLLATVPTSSGNRPQQLILLTTSACELHLSAPALPSPGLTDSTSYDLEVAQARGFAMTRLNELASRLPSKPILIIIKLVREVWALSDAGENVFWMDVMSANGWETIMG